MCIKLRKSKKNLETAICLRTIFSMINQLKKKKDVREKPNQTFGKTQSVSIYPTI